jgi:hypothetical protein
MQVVKSPSPSPSPSPPHPGERGRVRGSNMRLISVPLLMRKSINAEFGMRIVPACGKQGMRLNELIIRIHKECMAHSAERQQ